MKSRRILRTLLPAVALAGLTTARAADSLVIAEVGEKSVSASDLAPLFAGFTDSQRDALKQNPAALNQAVRLVLLQKVLLQEAEGAGWDKTPEVAAELARLRDRAVAESYLRTVAKVPDSYPSDAELKAAYEARKATFLVPRQLQLAQIYIAEPKGADKATADKTKSQVETLGKKLKQPNADFAALAREESEERQTAARGGEVGWVAENALQPEIRSRLGAKGSVTEAIRVGDGWFFVKVLDVKEARTPSFDEAKDQLARAMKAERFKQNQEAYLAKLAQQHPMAINELALTKLLEEPKQ
jgi:parvulin-like peptidyl-prolyl isomerase